MSRQPQACWFIHVCCAWCCLRLGVLDCGWRAPSNTHSLQVLLLSHYTGQTLCCIIMTTKPWLPKNKQALSTAYSCTSRPCILTPFLPACLPACVASLSLLKMHSVLQLSLVLSPTPVKRHGWRLDSARGCNSKAEAPWSSETGLACSRCFSHRGRDSYRMLDDNGSVVWLALAVMTQLDNIQLMCVVSEEISLGIIYVNRAATTDYFHHW